MTTDRSFVTQATEAGAKPQVFNVSRRGLVVGGGVLVLAVALSARRVLAKGFGADGMPHGWVDDPKVFVAIAEDGTTSITCHRSDMGQGVRTGWGIIIADELDANWDKVRIVQAVGKPVKLLWTRDDDIHHGYYHTVSVEHLEAGLDEKGMPIAWLHRSAAPTIGSIFAKGAEHELPFELGMGLINLPYAIPNIRMENPAADAHVRIGWFRSVSNIPHAFAVQSFVAELAHAAGRDQKDYLLDVIGPARIIDPTSIGDTWNHGENPKQYPIDTGRLRRVIETASQGIGWGKTMPKGSGLGVAGHYSFVTYTAVAAEVAVDAKGAISVPRVHIAVDCGPQVNPERIRSQMEGAIVMGMGLALTSEITFKDGKAVQNNFDGYEILRIDAAPKEIVVHLLPSSGWTQPLGGVGEPGVPPVAPAITNAIFAATGKRIRDLPIKTQLGA